MNARDRRVDRKHSSNEATGASQAGTSPLRKIVASAERFNAGHAEDVVAFNAATQNACGSGERISVQKLMAWQRKNGQTADGKVTKDAVATATDVAKNAVDVAFTDEEAGDVTKEDAQNADAPIADVAAQDEGGAENAPKMPEAEDKGLEEGTEAVHEGLEKTSEELELGEMAGAHGEAKMKAVAALAAAPYLLTLLKEHQYKKAIETIASLVGWEERAELLKLAAEKVCLSEPVIKCLEKAVAVGAVADVLLIDWSWTTSAFKAIAKAHEDGDAESLLGIYGYAWSDTITRGTHSNPGAVTAEEVEARDSGEEDGAATLEAQPELRFLLLAEYETEDNARRALEDSLYQREGINVKSHEGK